MPPRIDAAQLRSLLIVKLSSIGDVVHALPVATALRRQYPRLRITWAVEDWAAALVCGHPAIDRVVVFPPMQWGKASPAWLQSFRQALHGLRREPYDVSLDLQGLMKSAVVALCAGARLRIGTHGQREGAGLVSQPVPSRAALLHVVDDYLQCAEFLGASGTPVVFDVPIQSTAVAAIARMLGTLQVPPQAPLIVINPSASALWKTWPVQRWARVAEALADDGSVVLVGSREQAARHAELVRQAARRPYDLTGRTTLAELVALLDRCALHVAGDTGSAHIAAALGRPVAALYGPTPPWRKAPYGCEDLVVHRDGLCGATCPRLCLRGRRCLRGLSPDALVMQARRSLARATVEACS